MMTNYKENVAGFEKIDSAKAHELVKGEGEAVIYVGRATCPYCQKFVGKLRTAAEDTDTQIYYVNSEDVIDMEGVMDFRDEYGISTVPGLLFTDGDTVKVKCDSSMPEEEIKAFIHK